jgi:hypothetical protein
MFLQGGSRQVSQLRGGRGDGPVEVVLVRNLGKDARGEQVLLRRGEFGRGVECLLE